MMTRHRHWTSGQKIAFRFFFLFLSLQVLTENFTGNWFGRTRFVWTLGETIFVRPCLWLNHHVFHFPYLPPAWTTFSDSLHTIRDIVYLSFSVAVCAVWTALDRKRAGYDALHYWFSQCLTVALSCILFAYGVIKLFPVQMTAPSLPGLYASVGDLSPFRLLWTTFGYGKPYQVFCGSFEMTAGILVLFRRTRVAGLLITIAVMLNVLVVNYTFQVGVLMLSFYILLIALFLLGPHIVPLARFFLRGQAASLSKFRYVPQGRWPRILPTIMAVILLATSYFLNARFAWSLYTRTAAMNRSRQYALVTSYVRGQDTLQAVAGDTARWRLWGERVADGKHLVTIATMQPGRDRTYVLREEDSDQLLTLIPVGGQDTSALVFRRRFRDMDHWLLEGTIRQSPVCIEMRRFDPDTSLNLLRPKRRLIPIDDADVQY